jgi:hypothetical protein
MAFQKYATLAQVRRGSTSGLHRCSICFAYVRIKFAIEWGIPNIETQLDLDLTPRFLIASSIPGLGAFLLPLPVV